MTTTEIKLTQPCYTNDNRVLFPTGKTIEIPTPVALRWVANGRAVLAVETPEEKLKPTSKRKKK
jgi:hypothetical protein